MKLKVIQGSLESAKIISTTYGPLGRSVMIERPAGFITTKDGVTVANEIQLQDKIKNSGSKIIKEACVTVNDICGDGTTTTAILTAAILKEGIKNINAGIHPNTIIKGLKESLNSILQYIQSLSKPIRTQKELESIALIASNGDVLISKLMAKACMVVGQDGTIVIEDGNHVDHKLEFKDGAVIECEPVTKQFLNQLNERVFISPIVAVINSNLKQLKDVQNILEVASQWPDNPLIIYALDIDRYALKTLILNDHKNVVPCCAFNAPAYNNPTEFLKDIAALSGAKLINPFIDDITKWQGEWFGSFQKLSVKPNTTSIQTYADKYEYSQKRIQELKLIKKTESSEYNRTRIDERIAMLSGGLAIIQIGNTTEPAMKEMRSRVEDTLNSVKSALKKGIVPGGCLVYLHAARFCNNEILKKALTKPVLELVSKSNMSGQVIINHYNKNTWVGWDLSANDYRDFLLDPMIVDPTFTVETIITTAISTSCSLLSVDGFIV